MKLYTFQLIGTFKTQYSFQESEVIRDPGGGASDFVPTAAALLELEKELSESFGYSHSIESIDLHVDSDDLLNITDEGDA